MSAVLEHAAWPDAQVGLVVVPEHHDVAAAGVVQLQVVAEVDDRELDAGDTRRHAEQLRLVVPGLDAADAVRAARAAPRPRCRRTRAASRPRGRGAGAPRVALTPSRRRRRRPRAARAHARRASGSCRPARRRSPPPPRTSTRPSASARTRHAGRGRGRRRAPGASARRSGRRCRRRRRPCRCSTWRARRRRRTAPRIESAQARRAIASSQVRALESPRNAGSARHARTKVSWVTSSASFSPTRWSAKRQTSAWLARIACSSDVRSPSRASSHRRVRSSTATDDTGGTPEPS